MKLHDPKAKTGLQNRLRRIEGQLRGVQAMIEDERECREILQQLVAARSATQGAIQAFLSEYITGCLLEADPQDTHKREQLVDELITILGKVP